jgi:hypothetical protein
MSRASVLALGRAAAQAGMVDACAITRITGTDTDPDTGAVTSIVDTIYSGPCRVQELMSFARDATPTPPDPALMRYRILQLPVPTSDGVRRGDDVEITVCVNDPDLVGRPMRVRDQSGKTEATSRRVGIEEVT